MHTNVCACVRAGWLWGKAPFHSTAGFSQASTHTRTHCMHANVTRKHARTARMQSFRYTTCACARTHASTRCSAQCACIRTCTNASARGCIKDRCPMRVTASGRIWEQELKSTRWKNVFARANGVCITCSGPMPPNTKRACEVLLFVRPYRRPVHIKHSCVALGRGAISSEGVGSMVKQA